jgi:hypothetical protein
MSVDDTAKRLVGPARRALAAPARPPRPRLPSLQGSAFDDEERSTDSEIDNVLGGIQSVPPNASDAPAVGTSEAAPVPPAPPLPALPLQHPESAREARFHVLPPRDFRVTFGGLTVVLDKRQLAVITAVLGFGAFVLALAAVMHVVRGR